MNMNNPMNNMNNMHQQNPMNNNMQNMGMGQGMMPMQMMGN